MRENKIDMMEHLFLYGPSKPQIFIPQKFWQIGKNEIMFNKFFTKISKISLYIQLIILKYGFYFLCHILYF